MLKIKNIKWDTDGDKEVFASIAMLSAIFCIAIRQYILIYRGD